MPAGARSGVRLKRFVILSGLLALAAVVSGSALGRIEVGSLVAASSAADSDVVPTPPQLLTPSDPILSEPPVLVSHPNSTEFTVAYSFQDGSGSSVQLVDPMGEVRTLVRDEQQLFVQIAPSPAGDQIALTAVDSASGKQSIWVVALDGSSKSVLSVGTRGIPVWSPDGASLAVSIAQADHTWDAVGIDVVTGKATTLIDAGSYNLTPDWACSTLSPGFAAVSSWSPDGSIVLGEVSVPCFEATFVDLVVARVGGRGSATKLADVGDRNFGASFSPDGQQVVFSSDDGIYVTTERGSDAHRLGVGEEPVWNPATGDLAFVRGEFDIRGRVGANIQVGSPADFDATSREVDRVQVAATSPRWSPDGSLILFLAGDQTTTGVFVVNMQSGRQKTLIADPLSPVLAASFAVGRGR